MKITKEEMAIILNGREYRNEITDAEVKQAKDSGLVVVFGASDDLIEVCGAIAEEEGCSDGGTFLIGQRGFLRDWDDFLEDGPSKEDVAKYLEQEKTAKTIKAIWCGEPGYSWTYKTEIPHATFEIVEDAEKYCRGIVFDLEALK